MKQNLVLLIFIFITSPANATGKPMWNPDWSACTSDADCIQVKSCCSWMAINKNSTSAVQVYETKYCAKVECAAPGQRLPLISCVNRICKAQSFKK